MKILIGIIVGYLLFEVFKVVLAYPMGAFSKKMGWDTETGLMGLKVLSGFLAAVAVLLYAWLRFGRKPKTSPQNKAAGE